MNLSVNVSRLNFDLQQFEPQQYEDFWKKRNTSFISPSLLQTGKPTYLELGAGTGWFFVQQAKKHPEVQFIAVERDRMRGNQLVSRAKKSGLTNLAAFRGNAIPALMHGIPDQSLDRIYILYPCPWPKMSQRKHRWYLHPVMAHLVRTLKPGGLLIWASDQKFYIDEAQFVCTTKFQMPQLAYGQLAPNEYNDLQDCPGGRTKFEHHFLSSSLPCYELVVKKS